MSLLENVLTNTRKSVVALIFRSKQWRTVIEMETVSAVTEISYLGTRLAQTHPTPRAGAGAFSPVQDSHRRTSTS